MQKQILQAKNGYNYFDNMVISHYNIFHQLAHVCQPFIWLHSNIKTQSVIVEFMIFFVKCSMQMCILSTDKLKSLLWWCHTD